jgi:hypothetical protein
MSFRVPDHVHHRGVHGEVVILDTKTDRYLGLNASGAVIWEALVNGGSPADAADLVAERFVVSMDVAQRDVEALVQDLVRLQLLEPAQM